MRTIIEHLIQTLAAGEKAVIATVVEQSGSAPRGSGARMLITASGALYGTVGGGVVEAECCREANQLLGEEGNMRLLPFSLSREDVADAGLICGGKMKVLLEKQGAESLACWREVMNASDGVALISRLPQGEERGAEICCPTLLAADGRRCGAALGRELEQKIQSCIGQKKQPWLETFEKERFFVDPLVDSGTLWLVGGGHVGLAVAKVAAMVGFTVKVIDDRVEFANGERFPQADEVRVASEFANCFPPLGEKDYVVIVTRGHLYDQEVLAQALTAQPGYIGMIGSRKKRDTIYQNLRQQGVAATALEQVHSPIGLAIGAVTPEEIALSIVAELVSHRAGK